MIITDNSVKPRFNILHPVKSIKKINAFNWDKSQNDIDQASRVRRSAKRPIKKDWTEDYVINSELTKGLYHNQYPGFKLSGGLAYPVIAVPVSFMGFPIVKTKTEDKLTDEKLQLITERFIMEMKKIHIQSHRDGTCWVYPKYDSASGLVVLEFIPDDSITDIIKDLNTGKVIAIYTDEKISIKTGYDSVATARRIRVFTKQKIEVMYKDVQGSLSGVVKDKSTRNPIGILPVPFANNSDGSEIRGYSDYERIIPALKDYHDTKLAVSDILAKFKAKMVLEVQNVDEWLKQNEFDSIDEIEIGDIDLIMNLFEKEKVSFEFPERATDGHNLNLKNDFRLIVQGSGLAEIAFGVKTEGNANTAEEQMATVISLVKGKQGEKIRPYEILFMAIMRLYQIVEPGNSFQADNLTVTWDDMDAVSDKVKAEIFRNFAQGIAALMNVAGMTMQQMYNLWIQNYPNATTEDYNLFVTQLHKMSAFKRLTGSSETEAMENQGFDKNGNPSS